VYKRQREGRHAKRAAALQRAYDCYTRFGMTAQATRAAADASALGQAERDEHSK